MYVMSFVSIWVRYEFITRPTYDIIMIWKAMHGWIQHANCVFFRVSCCSFSLIYIVHHTHLEINNNNEIVNTVNGIHGL